MNFYRLSDTTFYNGINTIYKFIKPFLGKKKMSIFFFLGGRGIMEPLNK